MTHEKPFPITSVLTDYWGAAQAQEGKLRVATWNLHNLYHEDGQAIPRRGLKRTADDYAQLRKYADQLDADIIALQEVNSKEAIHRVFPEDDYVAFISGRKIQDDLAMKADSSSRTDGIYTGFAARKDISVVYFGDVPSLSVEYLNPRSNKMRPTRWGVEIEIDQSGHRLRLLSLHLKSGCTAFALDDDGDPNTSFQHPTDADCTTLGKQIAPLDAWIDEHEEIGTPFIVLGDFNRAFDVNVRSDGLWKVIDDRQPEGSRLWRYPFQRPGACWRGTPHYHLNPIDFIVLDGKANEWVNRSSFNWIVYDKSLSDHHDQISDHCPVYVDLKF